MLYHKSKKMETEDGSGETIDVHKYVEQDKEQELSEDEYFFKMYEKYSSKKEDVKEEKLKEDEKKPLVNEIEASFDEPGPLLQYGFRGTSPNTFEILKQQQEQEQEQEQEDEREDEREEEQDEEQEMESPEDQESADNKEEDEAEPTADEYMFDSDDEEEVADEELLGLASEEELKEQMESVSELSIDFGTQKIHKTSWKVKDEAKIRKQDPSFVDFDEDRPLKHVYKDYDEAHTGPINMVDAEQYERAEDLKKRREAERKVREARSTQRMQKVHAKLRERQNGEKSDLAKSSSQTVLIADVKDLERAAEQRRVLSTKLEKIVTQVMFPLPDKLQSVYPNLSLSISRIELSADSQDATVLWTVGQSLLDQRSHQARADIAKLCSEYFEMRRNDLREQVQKQLPSAQHRIRIYFRQFGKPPSEMEEIFARIKLGQ